uniref:Uncharacterized protein n=1 Tax=Picea sitchensis TaxID=3332 RepID=D5ADL2_PICSI|nr:unknown [Picea sitchensis]
MEMGMRLFCLRIHPRHLSFLLTLINWLSLLVCIQGCMSMRRVGMSMHIAGQDGTRDSSEAEIDSNLLIIYFVRVLPVVCQLLLKSILIRYQ